MAGIDDFKIRPRRGQYYLFSDDAMPKVKRIVHMTPTEKTKGVYAVTTVEGNLMLGPTAEDLDFDKRKSVQQRKRGLITYGRMPENFLHHCLPETKFQKCLQGCAPNRLMGNI